MATDGPALPGTEQTICVAAAAVLSIYGLPNSFPHGGYNHHNKTHNSSRVKVNNRICNKLVGMHNKVKTTMTRDENEGDQSLSERTMRDRASNMESGATGPSSRRRHTNASAAIHQSANSHGASRNQVSTSDISHTHASGAAESSIPRQRRSGKWIPEEEHYVQLTLEHFRADLLVLPKSYRDLRSYLAEQLNCDPVRITKKFPGEYSLGRHVYNPNRSEEPSAAAREEAGRERDQLIHQFHLALKSSKPKEGIGHIDHDRHHDRPQTPMRDTTREVSMSSNENRASQKEQVSKAMEQLLRDLASAGGQRSTGEGATKADEGTFGRQGSTPSPTNSSLHDRLLSVCLEYVSNLREATATEQPRPTNPQASVQSNSSSGESSSRVPIRELQEQLERVYRKHTAKLIDHNAVFRQHFVIEDPPDDGLTPIERLTRAYQDHLAAIGDADDEKPSSTSTETPSSDSPGMDYSNQEGNSPPTDEKEAGMTLLRLNEMNQNNDDSSNALHQKRKWESVDLKAAAAKAKEGTRSVQITDTSSEASSSQLGN